MLRYSLAVAFAIIALSSAKADPIPAGIFAQVEANAGPCPTCEIRIIRKTRDILYIDGNNKWHGVAAYDAGRGVYDGFIQWEDGFGGSYANYVHRTEWTFNNGLLTMTARSPAGTIIAKLRQKIMR